MGIYAVNGKEPVAAWIPSLDTAGNGTTTLTDLVGSSDGTLTNMDAGTDWPADTGAGGVRALDLDGSGDRVDVGQPISDYSAFTVAGWFKPTSSRYTQFALAQRLNHTIGWYALMIRNGRWRFEVKSNNGSWFNSPIISVSLGSWQHVVGVFTGTRVELYVDGARAGTGTAYSGAIPAPTVDASIGSQRSGFSDVNNYVGRVDDVRIFESALDSSDVAYLYDSGTGRGIVASGGGCGGVTAAMLVALRRRQRGFGSPYSVRSSFGESGGSITSS